MFLLNLSHCETVSRRCDLDLHHIRLSQKVNMTRGDQR